MLISAEHSLSFSVFFITVRISSSFSLLRLKVFLAKRATDVRIVAPAIPHPIGPASARIAAPAAVPPPPAASAPPPNHAKAAFVAAAPDNAEIAVPVEAVPNVVAIHIATLGAKDATAAPPRTPEPIPIAAAFLSFKSDAACS